MKWVTEHFQTAKRATAKKKIENPRPSTNLRTYRLLRFLKRNLGTSVVNSLNWWVYQPLIKPILKIGSNCKKIHIMPRACLIELPFLLLGNFVFRINAGPESHVRSLRYHAPFALGVQSHFALPRVHQQLECRKGFGKGYTRLVGAAVLCYQSARLELELDLVQITI